LIGLLRIAGVTAAGAVIWAAAASRVPDEARLPLALVVRGATVSQPFGCTTLALEPFDPFCPSRHVHTGIDLSAPLGTPVYSATSGVARVGEDPAACGLFVAVLVDPNVRLLYCHLLRADVAAGDRVIPGQRIGEVGVTGLTTAPHVHFEVQIDGRFVDPSRWLSEGS
jgi:murein DD-endopeptidase MepM/ murein hydrolase activator NlpD